MKLIKSLPPIVNNDSEILILGSFPGEKSLETGIYYASRGNRFWPMMARIYEEKLPNSAEEKNLFLKKHHLALWDVCASVKRKGSIDNKIIEHIPNDIESFLTEHHTIRKILVAGKKAQKLFKSSFKGIEPIPVPSTSGANRFFKEEEWQKALFS